MTEKQYQLGEDDAYLALQDAWQETLAVLGQHVNRPSFESWVKTARPIALDDGFTG